MDRRWTGPRRIWLPACRQRIGEPRRHSASIVAAGALSVVEIYCPLQAVIDREILNWVDWSGRPLDFYEGEFSVDEIDQVGPGGTFVHLESTAGRISTTCWNPTLYSVNSYEAWAADGSLSPADRARGILHDLKPAEGPLVSPEQQN